MASHLQNPASGTSWAGAVRTWCDKPTLLEVAYTEHGIDWVTCEPCLEARETFRINRPV